MMRRENATGDARERSAWWFLVGLMATAGAVSAALPAAARSGDLPPDLRSAQSASAAQSSGAGAPDNPAVTPDRSPPPVLPPLQFGGELRVRGESFDNPMDLDDDQPDAYQFVRTRYRVWADARPRESLRVYVRLGNEYRWGVYGTAPDFNKPAGIRDPESRVSLDNAWAEVSWPPVSGLAWRFGRMDLSYGDGFLVFDGTPADGSSSSFFDGLRLRYGRDDLEADLFAMKLVDRGFGSSALDEDLHGLHLKRAGVEFYTLHRYKHQATIAQQGKPWQVAQPRQRTLAVGNRLSHLPEIGWQGALEWAFEFGRYEDATSHVGSAPGSGGSSEAGRSAHGAQARAGRIWAGTARPGLELGGVYLSGDDPGTSEYEGWDDFYGEWPKYSDLLIYTMYDGTTRIQRRGESPARVYNDDAGAWANLAAAWIEMKGSPICGLRLTGRGTLLRAVEATGPGSGKERGLLAIAKAEYSGIPQVTLQALGEWFDPGDFYSAAADPAWYARFEVVTRF